jgi:ABC-type Zn uptake system ZnuABC Zn-binding protein ZnuA
MALVPRRPPALRAPCLLIIAAAAAVGCGSPATGGDSGAEVTAVATTTHVADLVRNVGGDRVAVEQFLTPGADPHDYEPRPSDAQAVGVAAVVFESGGDLDEWLGGVIENAGGDADVVTLLDAVANSREPGLDDDPHWWQDPRNAMAAVDAIAEALAEADPDGAAAYRRKARAYQRRLTRLDTEIERCMARIPDDQRKLVTTHDSYGHFAERYDVEVIGALIPSRSTQAQPSAGETAALVSQIEDEDVHAIFPESALNPELEEAVANETEATVGDALWADSLGPGGSGGETYVEALASDAEALAEGFSAGEAACRIDTAS